MLDLCLAPKLYTWEQDNGFVIKEMNRKLLIQKRILIKYFY
jgi:hypothetical protein